ncbi:hypothetical protein BC938DRAFT_482354 [Jimgerdemannia flammicorona]|uniref:Uncharacterized protein n=1 Tax=Jimgerdemannia flammicorona TaxID=994334 RepID=A0A433QE91_9FUNG|nr:hypothetical protein BC938DRAFT_482354 [Jimgerdemannia flammicorona]
MSDRPPSAHRTCHQAAMDANPQAQAILKAFGPTLSSLVRAAIHHPKVGGRGHAIFFMQLSLYFKPAYLEPSGQATVVLSDASFRTGTNDTVQLDKDLQRRDWSPLWDFIVSCGSTPSNVYMEFWERIIDDADVVGIELKEVPWVERTLIGISLDLKEEEC